jgi:hypothetical protein
MGVGTEYFHCPDCDAPGHVRVYRSINVRLEPDLRNQILEDGLNLFRCICCDFTTRVVAPVLYHDPVRQFAVWYVPYASEEEFYQLIDSLSDTNGYLSNAPMYGEWFRFKHTIVELERAYDAGYTLVRRPGGLFTRMLAQATSKVSRPAARAR